MFERLGFIGLGRMGSRMATRLIGAGHPLVVFDVIPGKASPLAQLGAEVAETPSEIAESAVAVFTSVTDGPSLQSVLNGPNGLLTGAPPGLLLVEMSTIGVDDSREVASACAAHAVRYVRSPVLGTLDAAAGGTLNALLSGPRDAVDDALPLLAHLTDQHRYFGEAEEARVVKLMVNGMLAVTMASFAEVLVVGERAGLDVNVILDLIVASGMGGPATRGAAEMVRTRDFEPRLTSDLMLKDLRLLEDLARSTQTALPVTSATEQLFAAVSAMGWGNLDRAAVLLVLERLAGIETP